MGIMVEGASLHFLITPLNHNMYTLFIRYMVKLLTGLFNLNILSKTISKVGLTCKECTDNEGL